MKRTHQACARAATVVERAIAQAGGYPSEFARRLSQLSGIEINRQRVHGWRLRGVFPRAMLTAVEMLTRIPLNELISARQVHRAKGSAVARAIRLLGAEANAATLATELTRMSGRKITRQRVNNWQANEQFPLDIVPFVHLLTKIPVKELIEPGPANAYAAREAEKDPL